MIHMIYNLEQAVKHLVDKEIDRFYFVTNACPGFFEKECERIGWKFDIDYDYNGWDVDWWGTITADKNKINIYGSMYYGTATLRLLEND